MTETDTLYSALGEAETHAKDLEGKLNEAKNRISALLTAMKMAESHGPHIFDSVNYKAAIAKAEKFLQG